MGAKSGPNLGAKTGPQFWDQNWPQFGVKKAPNLEQKMDPNSLFFGPDLGSLADRQPSHSVRALDVVVFGFWFAPNLLPQLAAFVPKHTSIQARVKGCRPIRN